MRVSIEELAHTLVKETHLSSPSILANPLECSHSEVRFVYSSRFSIDL